MREALALVAGSRSGGASPCRSNVTNFCYKTLNLTESSEVAIDGGIVDTTAVRWVGMLLQLGDPGEDTGHRLAAVQHKVLANALFGPSQAGSLYCFQPPLGGNCSLLQLLNFNQLTLPCLNFLLLYLCFCVSLPVVCSPGGQVSPAWVDLGRSSPRY